VADVLGAAETLEKDLAAAKSERDSLKDVIETGISSDPEINRL
jgi:hypothetical protein